MTIFVEYAKGIITNNQRKGNFIVIGYQRGDSRCSQAGRGVANGQGSHHGGNQTEAHGECIEFSTRVVFGFVP